MQTYKPSIVSCLALWQLATRCLQEEEVAQAWNGPHIYTNYVHLMLWYKKMQNYNQRDQSFCNVGGTILCLLRWLSYAIKGLINIQTSLCRYVMNVIRYSFSIWHVCIDCRLWNGQRFGRQWVLCFPWRNDSSQVDCTRGRHMKHLLPRTHTFYIGGAQFVVHLSLIPWTLQDIYNTLRLDSLVTYSPHLIWFIQSSIVQVTKYQSAYM